MNDDIIRMAREAGIPIEFDWAGRPSTLVIKDGGTCLRGIQDLKRFAALVRADERERIAAEWDGCMYGDLEDVDIGAAIRARSKE